MEDKLQKSIEEYLNKENIEYAIMINGHWGSGKTYYIKNTIVPKYNNTICISLYGITDVSEISEKLYYEILKNKKDSSKILNYIKKIKDKYKRIKKITDTIDKIIKFIWNKFKKLIWVITHNVVKLKFDIDLSKVTQKNIVGIINLFDKINEYIIIVDDLERSAMEIEEVFGFFNNLVEHKKVKCIFIANEEEIEKAKSSNYEIKLLTCLNNQIDFKNIKYKEDNIRKIMGLEDDNNKKIKLEELNKRIEYVYEKDSRYKTIKEKLIGQTFNYVPDIDQIYECIIESYKKCEDFYKILVRNKENIIDIMKINECKNVRTLKIIIDNLNSLYKSSIEDIKEMCGDKKELIIDKIVKNVVFSTIGLKKGVKLSELLKGAMTTTVSLEDEEHIPANKYFLAFNFVNDFIETSIFDKEEMVKTLNYYMIQNYELLSENDPYKILDDYWEKDANELSNALDGLLLNLDNNDYNYKLFPKIIARISSIEVIGFEKTKTDLIIEKIEEYFENNMIDYVDFHEFLTDKDTAEVYNKHVERIQKIMKEKKSENNSNDLRKMYNSPEWGIKIYEYTSQNKDYYLSQKSFIRYIDIQEIINKIKVSNNNNIFHFKYAIDMIYKYNNLKEYYIEDVPVLKEISLELSKIIQDNEYDKMKMYAIETLKEAIDNKIEKVKQQV